MQDDRFAHPIWQLDPCYGDEPSYDDYERLFLAAYRATFHLHASPARVRPYVTRYLRFYVAAPWVREFASTRSSDPLAAELARAPLDPVIDWRHLARWFEGCAPLLYALHASRWRATRPGDVRRLSRTPQPNR
jgi:hypothetical protein